MALGKMWQKCEDWNASDLEIWINKINSLQKLICTKITCVFSVYTTNLPHDVLSLEFWKFYYL